MRKMYKVYKMYMLLFVLKGEFMYYFIRIFKIWYYMSIMVKNLLIFECDFLKFKRKMNIDLRYY